ncbi:hypothetical protein [Desulfoluna butyratoxydans]|uniref:Uncharacterized protein n=1 Tax=Desulfoluna butyratoxydans TaxID=231438 RepID=A0A4U8YV14_9BACT|nr:hypothetical protein [Desulfoluna butyratoxydans]VFQ47427.1 hypothetical protein MSL71_51270 [Desulfoluna butyratoxydans]
MIKKGLIGVLFLVLSGVVYLFLWGFLFPWSPVKPGYAHEGNARWSVYYPEGTALPDDYGHIGDLMEETEAFHHLAYTHPVKVILCATSAQYRRYSTQRSHLCTMGTGTVIYVNPTVKETKRDIRSFLKHELSHALVFQHMTLPHAFKLKRWIREGLAVYYGNPHHYYQGDAFLSLAVDKGYFFDFTGDDGENPSLIGHIPADRRYLFEYAEYRCFVDYLMTHYGSERFFAFLNLDMRAPEAENEAFRQVYEVELSAVFQQFKQEVMARHWPGHSDA